MTAHERLTPLTHYQIHPTRPPSHRMSTLPLVSAAPHILCSDIVHFLAAPGSEAGIFSIAPADVRMREMVALSVHTVHRALATERFRHLAAWRGREGAGCMPWELRCLVAASLAVAYKVAVDASGCEEFVLPAVDAPGATIGYFLAAMLDSARLQTILLSLANDDVSTRAVCASLEDWEQRESQEHPVAELQQLMVANAPHARADPGQPVRGPLPTAHPPCPTNTLSADRLPRTGRRPGDDAARSPFTSPPRCCLCRGRDACGPALRPGPSPFV